MKPPLPLLVLSILLALALWPGASAAFGDSIPEPGEPTIVAVYCSICEQWYPVPPGHVHDTGPDPEIVRQEQQREEQRKREEEARRIEQEKLEKERQELEKRLRIESSLERERAVIQGRLKRVQERLRQIEKERQEAERRRAAKPPQPASMPSVSGPPEGMKAPGGGDGLKPDMTERQTTTSAGLAGRQAKSQQYHGSEALKLRRIEDISEEAGRVFDGKDPRDKGTITVVTRSSARGAEIPKELLDKDPRMRELAVRRQTCYEELEKNRKELDAVRTQLETATSVEKGALQVKAVTLKQDIAGTESQIHDTDRLIDLGIRDWKSNAAGGGAGAPDAPPGGKP